MIAMGASDLHLKAAAPPIVRVHGVLTPLKEQPLSLPECENLIFSSMTHAQQQEFIETHELDYAYGLHGHGRFRVNAFFQRGTASAAFRTVRLDIPGIDELRLPPILRTLCQQQDGLILLTGATGTGKSTTLASMIDYINTTQRRHIVTIEDPIEFIHVDKMSIVSQREVGIDTQSFTVALKQALRQDPDVVLIGEMRDPETIVTALTAAETGHLVMSTLHTQNATQAIERIMDALPEGNRKQFMVQLATSLRGIISQRLLARLDGNGRVPAIEVLIATPTIRSLILESKFADMYQYISAGRMEGMQTFTQSLLDLYQSGLVTEKEAYSKADKPTEFRLAIEGHITSGADLQEMQVW
ncbi:MAG: type IV pilus twitching motility protein PilT [Candidatus Eremiobacteraeota bacterium]|nr:type IV pilus twitching motility protein PilT [Candidatus Eremiobacteraeota bacterium]MBC5826758.1 type IV pilus twitching motility protein PilT [Candidatus Eremiobacteraeota bacterium]